MAKREKEGGVFDSMPSIQTRDDIKLAGMPVHPIPRGGQLPNLGLAEFNVASGSSVQTMPDHPRPEVVWPSLKGSLEDLGHDPSNPVPPAPNLVGIDGIPTMPTGIHGPDSKEPDWPSLNPSLQPRNFSDPVAADFKPETTTETYSPTGMGHSKPPGLDIRDDPYGPDPVLSSYLTIDIPTGLTAISDAQANDPMMPDLQSPMIGLPVQMQERPGDTMVDGASRRERRGMY